MVSWWFLERNKNDVLPIEGCINLPTNTKLIDWYKRKKQQNEVWEINWWPPRKNRVEVACFWCQRLNKPSYMTGTYCHPTLQTSFTYSFTISSFIKWKSLPQELSKANMFHFIKTIC